MSVATSATGTSIFAESTVSGLSLCQIRETGVSYSLLRKVSQPSHSIGSADRRRTRPAVQLGRDLVDAVVQPLVELRAVEQELRAKHERDNPLPRGLRGHLRIHLDQQRLNRGGEPSRRHSRSRFLCSLLRVRRWIQAAMPAAASIPNTVTTAENLVALATSSSELSIESLYHFTTRAMRKT